MKLRETEKYAVDFANTERLKGGSIITMQRYLNEDEAKTRRKKVWLN